MAGGFGLRRPGRRSKKVDEGHAAVLAEEELSIRRGGCLPLLMRERGSERGGYKSKADRAEWGREMVAEREVRPDI